MKKYILNSLLLFLLGLTVILQIQSVESSNSLNIHLSSDTPLQNVIRDSQEFDQFGYLLQEHPHLLPDIPYTILIPHNTSLPDFQKMSSKEEQDFLQTHIIPDKLTYEELSNKGQVLTANKTCVSHEDIGLEKSVVFDIETQEVVIHGINTPLY